MIKQENSGCYKMENRKDNFDKFMSGEEMFSDDNSADDFDRSGDYSYPPNNPAPCRIEETMVK